MELKNRSEKWNGSSDPHVGPPEAIMAMALLELIEGSLLSLIIRSSWSSYVRANRRARHSLCDFLRKLSFIRKCFIGSGTVIFLFNSLSLLQLMIPIRYDDYMCTLFVRLNAKTSYSISMASIYVFLWTRQYLLHSSPILRAVIPRWFYFISKLSLVLTVAAFIIPVLLTWRNGNLPLLAFYENGNCFFKITAFGISTQTFTTVMTIFTVITQMSYMFLFYKTLKMHQEVNKVAANNQSNERLQRQVHRCFAFTIITVISDCITMIFVRLIPPTTSLFLAQVVSKTDLMVNMVCMVFCFNTLPGFVVCVIKIITCGQLGMKRKEKSSAKRNSEGVLSTVAENVESSMANNRKNNSIALVKCTK